MDNPENAVEVLIVSLFAVDIQTRNNHSLIKLACLDFDHISNNKR